ELDGRLSLRLQAEHRVEARGVVDLGHGEVHELRHVLEDVGAEPARLLLGEAEHGQEGRALDRIARDDLVELLLVLGRELHGYQSRAPAFQAYTNPPPRSSTKTDISTKPKTPRLLKMSAQG